MIERKKTVVREAKFGIGQRVRHRHYNFRGVIFDVDESFDHLEEWLMSIPDAIRPSKDQPFYHLLAEQGEVEYIAYVSEQNIVPDDGLGIEIEADSEISDILLQEHDGSWYHSSKKMH